jgi:hypothetical protein
LDGESALRKAATYTITEYTQTYIHALSGIRTHDPSVPASEDSSCLRPRGHCNRQYGVSVAEKTLIVGLKALGAKMNRLAVNRQS